MGWFRGKEHDEERLSAYLDGELTSRQAEIVERHVSTCSTCSALLEELRETRALLSDLPSQTPRRSFVLGAEYARAPVKEAAPWFQRFGLALVPAAALTVFVALVFVDLAGSSSTSSDHSATGLAATTMRDESKAAGGAAALAPEFQSAPSSAGAGEPSGSTAGASESAPGNEPSPSAPSVASAPAAGAPGAGTTADGTAQDSSTPNTATAIQVAPEASPSEAEAANAAADASAPEQPGPLPTGVEVPQQDNGGGLSTLRVLEIVALVGFLASGFYVFIVRPKLSRREGN
jgi:Putative zinc-finger